MIIGFQVKTAEKSTNFVPPGLSLSNRKTKMSVMTDVCEGEATALATSIVDMFNNTDTTGPGVP